ncbi:hypothetical protein N7495_007947 [Penicillium taxi]|uniref:uncharacterized protein n=1 Tax=Penicillium taxi TaxID=168475 RepID=UPI002544F9A8|nr:uncharacterized protein N7495_007947 [Penicillium taxi]KAJ5887906.1 hypothetical protein N7495_007947 [Penicillium taxi]
MRLFSIHRILATVLPLVLCQASTSAASSNETSSALWEMVPKCARICLENFIKTEYSSEECTEQSNIRCLCRTKSAGGLTIGEAGLSCAYALCSTEVFKSSEVYNICESVPDALAETHATITATTFAAPSSTATDTIISSPKITLKTTSATTAELTATSTFTSILTTLSSTVAITVFHSTSTEMTTTRSEVVSITSSTETSSTSSITALTTSNSSSNSTASTQKKHVVSPGTVIGVSVTSGVASSFLIGVAVFYCCKKWKKKKQSDTEKNDFEIGGTMSEPPGFSAPSSRHGSPRPGPGPGSGLGLSTLEENNLSRTFHLPSQYSQTHAAFLSSKNPHTSRGEDRIGFAITSESDGEASPHTASSQRTLSRLLPTGLYPKPLKWSHRPSSGETVFEEDELQSGLEKKPRVPQKSSPLNPMAGLPANPRALKNGFPAQKYQRVQNPQSPPGQSPRVAPAGPRSAPKPGLSFAERALQPTNQNTSNLAPNNSTMSSQRTSIRLLTPPTFYPDLEPRTNDTSPKKPGSPKPIPPPKPMNSGKVIPQPRLIRGDDIKRVEIRKSPRPPPSEVVAAYSPEDFWLQRSRPLPPTPDNLPYPSESYPTTVIYPPTHDQPPQGDKKRISPTSRKVTPSRRGDDLILSVD